MQVKYHISTEKITIKGDFDVIVKAYLKEFGFRRNKRIWEASLQIVKVPDFVSWLEARGITVEQSESPLVIIKTVSIKPVRPARVVYYYGKSQNQDCVTLRGKATIKNPEVNDYLRHHGYRWVFRSGRRRIMAWQALKSPLALIEDLLWFQQSGYLIEPSPTLQRKKWLYLDKPKVFNTLTLSIRLSLPPEQLINWLSDNGYERLTQIESPGDFSAKGEVLLIWTKENDDLIRVVYDGDEVESLTRVDPESLIAVYETNELVINGLVESLPPMPTSEAYKPCITTEVHEPHKVVAPSVPRQKKKKYNTEHVQRMTKSFSRLDEKHPFFNMIKWNST